MFGGCLRDESGKTYAVPKLARVVVLDFGEQNTYMTLCRCLKWESIESQMMLCQINSV